MKRMRQWLAGLLMLLLTVCPAVAQNSPLQPVSNSLLAGTDDLGRSLPTWRQAGPPKPDHYVGLFYWQWHTGLRAGSDYDMTEYLKLHPKQLDYSAFPADGPAHPTWYWAQPMLGYYRSDDPWVIRRHLAWMAGNGIDFLFFDYTNGSVYDRELTTFFKEYEALAAQGAALPRLTFFLNYQPEWKIESLYKNWYQPGRHADQWFKWKGKPLLLAEMPTDASKLKEPGLLKEIQHFFTFRPTWALDRADKNPRLWRFLSEPDTAPALGPDGKVEEMVVNKSMGGPIWGAIEQGGVSYQKGQKHTAADYDDQWLLPDAANGAFFQAEWDHARAVNPPVLLITGWNEWTASVWETPGVVMLGRPTAKGQGHIVDEYNMQFNRDIEPLSGGYGDDYFWQFLINLRLYKGVAPATIATAGRTIALDGPIAQWDAVKPVYSTFKISPARDWESNVKGIHYKNDSVRNEIVLCQVCCDSKAIYFHARAREPLVGADDGSWMNLWIDRDESRSTGFDGYDLLVNRSHSGQSASLEISTGPDWRWTKLADVPMHVEGRDITIAIPRREITADRPAGRPLQFQFKWTDHVPLPPRMQDWYTQGCSAPPGRFNNRFVERSN